MAGRIVAEDIETLKERVSIADIVGEYVRLSPSGIDSLKGLCPFHDEDTPSFHVRPGSGYYHCFGCGAGGDTLKFVQDYLHLSFIEAVEHLADKIGLSLRYEDTPKKESHQPKVTRARLLEANRQAALYYATQLETPAAKPARDFLLQRKFNQQVAKHFQLGYAPASRDGLLNHLRKMGFIEAELSASGLMVQSERGLLDRFRNRLIWPIKDLTGAVVGFGARKLKEDDYGPKYLNTPETMLYKKSQVLYGIELAKKAITSERRIVVVEGYTDVMAAHLAGIECAVATCGTAFGHGHVQIARRLLGDKADPASGVIFADGKTRGGEVIFTFDGDEAGQKAALRAFNEDQNFSSQTFVAVDPDGKDPCDLYQEQGIAAVQKLVASRRPLFEFVLQTLMSGYNLDTAEGRSNALAQCAPVIKNIRDYALANEYIRLLGGWLGLDIETVRRAVKAVSTQQLEQFRKQQSEKTSSPRNPSLRPDPANPRANMGQTGNTSDNQANTTPRQVAIEQIQQELLQQANLANHSPGHRLETETLAGILQYPYLVAGQRGRAIFDLIGAEAFQNPIFKNLFQLLEIQGGIDTYISYWQDAEAKLGAGYQAIGKATERWLHTLCENGKEYARVITALHVFPLSTHSQQGIEEYLHDLLRSLLCTQLSQQIRDLKAKMQREESLRHDTKEIFAEIVGLENLRRKYRVGE